MQAPGVEQEGGRTEAPAVADELVLGVHRASPGLVEHSMTRHRAVFRHPGLQHVVGDRLKWFRDKIEEESLFRNKVDLCTEQRTLHLKPGQSVYGMRPDGSFVRGTLISVRRSVKNRLIMGKVRIIEAGTEHEEVALSHRYEKFRLPSIFPVGGCNGGIELHLHTMLRAQADSVPEEEEEFAQTFLAGKPLKGSPLWRITGGSAPTLEKQLMYLDEQRIRIMQMPFDCHTMSFDAEEIMQCRREFRRSMVKAETRLQRFSETLAQFFYPGSRFSRLSAVMGEVTNSEGGKERFTVVEPLSDEMLWSLMPGECVAKRKLAEMRVLPKTKYYSDPNTVDSLEDEEQNQSVLQSLEAADYSIPDAYRFEKEVQNLEDSGWQKPVEVTKYVGYEALSANDLKQSHGVSRFFAHTRSAAEVLDIVTDKLCCVDFFLRSSDHRGYSNSSFIGNLMSIKLVVDGNKAARSLVKTLEEVRFSPELLRRIDVPFYQRGHPDCTEELEILERHDRLGQEDDAGWHALTLTVRWWGIMVSILIEPLEVYYREQEQATEESYGRHKQDQKEARQLLSQRWQLYTAMRSLVEWVLHEGEASNPMDSPLPEIPERLSNFIRLELRSNQ